MVLSPPVLAGERVRAPFPHFPPAAAAVSRLGPRACRWPMGEPGDAGFTFCGAGLPYRGSYCALHARMARAGSFRRGGRA